MFVSRRIRKGNAEDTQRVIAQLLRVSTTTSACPPRHNYLTLTG